MSVVEAASIAATSERLLPRSPATGLAEHLALYGHLPPFARHRRELFQAVAESGLTGRGGAGFPTATKLRAVAARGGRPVVVANGTEGEPASLKDKVLLAHSPHLVLDGVLAAAAVVGADEAIIAVSREAKTSFAAGSGVVGTQPPSTSKHRSSSHRARATRRAVSSSVAAAMRGVWPVAPSTVNAARRPSSGPAPRARWPRG